MIADLKLILIKRKIKDNFQIKGFLKDLQADILKNYKVEKLDLIFDYKKDNLTLQNIDSSIK